VHAALHRDLLLHFRQSTKARRTKYPFIARSNLDARYFLFLFSLGVGSAERKGNLSRDASRLRAERSNGVIRESIPESRMISTTRMILILPPLNATQLNSVVGFTGSVYIYDTRYISIVRHYDRAEFSEFLTPERLKSRRTNKKPCRAGRMARSWRGESPHSHTYADARTCGYVARARTHARTHARSGDGRYNDGRGVPYSV